MAALDLKPLLPHKQPLRPPFTTVVAVPSANLAPLVVAHGLGDAWGCARHGAILDSAESGIGVVSCPGGSLVGENKRSTYLLLLALGH